MMTQTAPAADAKSETSQHFDVGIVGAGISGIGAAYHLKTQCPGMSFVILEAQDSFGGTWITHRYPGIRSDSDLKPSAIASSHGSADRLRPLRRFSPISAK
jgi:cation diffusion facilitator CzcD-associated flavoprotein CzcO